MKIEELKKYKKRKIAILGFGKEGKSNLDFLLRLGMEDITILDKNININKNEKIKYILGEYYLNNINQFDLIFKSPGISPYNPHLSNHKNIILNQTQIFFNNYKGKVIGITGTKGKSTTSTLTYEILKNIGYNVKLVGNIGNPVLDEINIIKKEKYDFIVFELSSYMLDGLNINLFIGVINNIYDCHLDWHNGKDNYIKAKFGVFKSSKFKLANYELKEKIEKKYNCDYFGEYGKYSYKKGIFYMDNKILFKDKNILLEGEHNRKNICLTIGILNIIDSTNFTNNLEIFKKTLSTFTGLNHRIQKIGIFNEIIFIDDAIATTPESTIAALKTFEHNIGTILLGGQDSGFNFDKLKNILEKYNIKNIVLFPDTGEKIFGDLNSYEYEIVFKLKGNYSPNIFKTKSMKSAIDFSFKNTPKGKICILSNAAPSFSLWSGYIEKGLSFQKEVINYNKTR